MLEIAFITVVGQILLPLALVMAWPGESRSRTSGCSTYFVAATWLIAVGGGLAAGSGPAYGSRHSASGAASPGAVRMFHARKAVGTDSDRLPPGAGGVLHRADGLVAGGQQPNVGAGRWLAVENGTFYVAAVSHSHQSRGPQPTASAYRRRVMPSTSSGWIGRPMGGRCGSDLQILSHFRRTGLCPRAEVPAEDRLPDLTPPDRPRHRRATMSF
jgi:hypothetical protein